MDMDVDVAIAGGGMVGMTLAIALAQAGMSVAVIEKNLPGAQLEPAFDGRVSAIALGSRHVLEAVGAWDRMAPHAEPIFDIRVSDGASPFSLHYCHKEVGGDPFGYIVENRHIRKALHDAALGDMACGSRWKIRLIAPSEIVSFASDDGAVTLALADAPPLRCRLLVGADGKQSRVRSMAGIGVSAIDYRQTAIVCTVAHALPHHGLAQERFLPAGPFAVLPMQHNRSSLVWVEPGGRAAGYLALAQEEFEQEIQERMGGYLGKIRLEGGRFSYPLGVMHAKDYIAGRVALVGDAAHAIHPIAGQGVNMGFRDVAALTEVLGGRFALGLDIGAHDALAHYRRWRRFDNVTMLAATDGLNRLFSNAFPPLQMVRGLGLWAVSHVPPLKRFFMRHAMGLVGDLPPMMKKEACGENL